MGTPLPFLREEPFVRRLRAVVPVPLEGVAEAALYVHYLELRRFNRTTSLVGPGTAGSVVERHYGESLAALPWVQTAGGRLLDVGSGAGFPGFVLAAACPRLSVCLVESKSRKATFLRHVSARQ